MFSTSNNGWPTCDKPVGHNAGTSSILQEMYTKFPTDRVAQDRLLNLLDRKVSDEQRKSCESEFFEVNALRH